MAYQEPFDPDAYLARISQGRVDTTEFDPDAYLARLNQTKLTPLADVESLLGSTIEPPRGQAIQDLLTAAPVAAPTLPTARSIYARPPMGSAAPMPIAEPIYARPPVDIGQPLPTPDVRSIDTPVRGPAAATIDRLSAPTPLARDPINELLSRYAGPGPVVADTLRAPPPSIDAPKLASPVNGQTIYDFGPYETGYRNSIENTPGMLNRQGIGIKVDPGTPVQSVASGVVESTGPLSLYENHVVVKHSDGTRGVYLYLGDSSVALGQEIKAGDVLGTSGGEKTPEGPHVEFQIRTAGNKPTAFAPNEWLPAVADATSTVPANGMSRLREGPIPAVPADTRPMATPARIPEPEVEPERDGVWGNLKKSTQVGLDRQGTTATSQASRGYVDSRLPHQHAAGTRPARHVAG